MTRNVYDAFVSRKEELFFGQSGIPECCCCRNLGKMINKSKRICRIRYVFCTDGSQEHSFSSWSFDCRLDGGELGFDSLEDQRQFSSPRCFVRDTCPTQSLLREHWVFVPKDKVAETLVLVRTATEVPSCRATSTCHVSG